VPQATQILPASLRRHLSPSLLKDPDGDFWAGPQLVIGSWLVKRFLQLADERGRKDRLAARIVVATVSQSLRPLLIVAADKAPDPARTVASHLGNLLRGFPSAKQPDDLPMASADAFFGLAVAL